MGLDAPSHWVILLIAAVVLFGGYKKLPEITRSVGRSLRIFKTEMKGLTEDDAARTAPSAGAPAVPPASTPQVPPSLGADTHAGVPGSEVPRAEPSQPAAEAPREAPQQQS